MSVRDGSWRAHDRIARWLADKAWTARPCVPIVVRKVMKCALRDGGPATCARFKSDSDIKMAPGHLTGPRCDDARRFIFRGADPSLVRMAGEKTDGIGRRCPVG